MDDIVELLIATESLVIIGLERERGHSANVPRTRYGAGVWHDYFQRQLFWSCFHAFNVAGPLEINTVQGSLRPLPTCMYMYKVHIRFDDDESLFLSRNPKGAISLGSNNVGYLM